MIGWQYAQPVFEAAFSLGSGGRCWISLSMKSQLAVASVSLFLLGVLWGSDHKVLVTTCVLGDVLSGEVTNVRYREQSRTQYVFRS